MRHARIPLPTKLAVIGAAALLAAALQSKGIASAAGRTVAPGSILPGTVLRVGEQLKNLTTILSLGGQDRNFPYQVQYSEFVGGPAMLQDFEGGGLDVGFIQSTPLIFAQAAGQPPIAQRADPGGLHDGLAEVIVAFDRGLPTAHPHS